jgi:hypothetical protein
MIGAIMVFVGVALIVVGFWFVEKHVEGGVFTKGRENDDVVFEDTSGQPTPNGRFEVSMKPWTPDYPSAYKTHVRYEIVDTVTGKVRSGYIHTDKSFTAAIDMAKNEVLAGVSAMKEEEKFANVKYKLD